MGKFLTQKVRIEQTAKTRIFRILDNELYKDDDGFIYIVPRYFQTDNYSIPLWIAAIGGSPVEYRLEPAHLHDFACDCYSLVYTTLTEEELKEKGLLRFSQHRGLWVCENIPKEYLRVKSVGKVEANNLLFSAMKSSGIPLQRRAIVRFGVCMNLNWYINKWRHKGIAINLDRFYDSDYWDELIPIV